MISREDLIAQSVQTHVRSELFGATYNYDTTKVEIVDGYEDSLFNEQYGSDALDKTYIAVAFQFDNGGRPLEVGSSLRQFLHTIDFLVFGKSPSWGRNVAYITKQILLTDSETIPLLDYNVSTDPRPEIDRLVIDSCITERQQIFDPRPWQLHSWRTRLRVLDEAYSTTPV